MVPVVRQIDVNTYDEKPYRSYPYFECGLDYLRTIGRLFGMDPPEVETARVLDLGCAEGGNIIGQAAKYSKAEFIGVDLSKVQIDAGLKHLKKLRLKNIELKHMSISDIDQSFGQFDYIICHGVISWVPAVVRDKIIEVCSKNLRPKGIVYVSYNTLPGWNMVKTIRDMMLYHTQRFADLEEKISQSKSLLNFVSEALRESTTPYALMLKEEAEMLSKYSGAYVRHDYMAEENNPFYFSEFIAKANKQDLQYLADCILSKMYVGNLPQTTAEKLLEISDIVTTEQYMDFITNCRFRRTLLCHKNMTINRELENAMARNFTMSARVFTDRQLSEVDLEADETITFYFNESKKNTISTDSPATKAILYTFSETQCNPLGFDEIVDRANAKLKGDNRAKIEEELEDNAIFLLMKGMFNFFSETGNYGKVNLDKPKLFKIALHQIRNTSNRWVTNLMNDPVNIGYFDRLSGKYMNGRNTVSQILEKLIEEAKAEKFTMAVDKKSISEDEDLRQSLSFALNKTIDKFSKAALFV